MEPEQNKLQEGRYSCNGNKANIPHPDGISHIGMFYLKLYLILWDSPLIYSLTSHSLAYFNLFLVHNCTCFKLSLFKMVFLNFSLYSHISLKITFFLPCSDFFNKFLKYFRHFFAGCFQTTTEFLHTEHKENNRHYTVSIFFWREVNCKNYAFIKKLGKKEIYTTTTFL